mmetsp:Transcript_5520/g.11192  ORF Transcript_5520/g.11192 Transcript_5520/m.11192 type:complete len:102 (+) Transcript_5520:143-448(+)
MSNFFNPGSAKYRRGVLLASVYACSFVTATMLVADYGSQEHVLTPVQTYINKKLDAFYQVKHEELYGPRKVGSESKPIFTMRRVDLDSNGNIIDESKPPKR